MPAIRTGVDSPAEVDIMTTPSERTRAVLATRQFLEELCAGDEGLGLPKAVRTSARQLLRHYPGTWHIDMAAVAWPMAWAPASPQQAQAPSYLELLAFSNSQAAKEDGEAGTAGKPTEPDDATS
jgi:hypothetical protein